MRLGIVTSSYSLSASDARNAGVFVRDLAQQLAIEGHQVAVLAPWAEGNKEHEVGVSLELFRWLGDRHDIASQDIHHPINLVRQISLLISGAWHVNGFVRRNKPDALLAMWAIPSGMFSWLASRLWGVRYGVWVLGSDIWNRGKYPLGGHVVRKVLTDASFRFADGFALGAEVEQISGLPCSFVPSSRKLPASSPQHATRTEGTPTRFLFVGRYESNKGPDILIDAMKILLDQGQYCELRMFGGGSLKSALERQILGYESQITINDYATPQEVSAQMTTCDWLVIPSRIESIPLVFSDAVQAGIPMVATQVGDLGRLLDEFHIGIKAQEAEAAKLADAMRHAINTGRSEFQAGFGRAVEFFDLEAAARQVVQAFSSSGND